MILCIDSNALKVSEKVQKDIDLDGLLVDHTKYFDTVGEALKDNYLPLNFSISIRSIYDNTVLRSKTSDGKYLYYTNLTEIQPFVHKGIDLLMYLCSIGIMMNVNYKKGFDDIMIKHSQFQPIGLYYTGTVVDPIIYSHIIMSDDGMKLLEPYLQEGREIVTINTMREQSDGNILAMLEELKEVKSNHE